MNAGPKYEYRWADENIKTPIKVSASEYASYLVNWVSEQFANEAIFPTNPGIETDQLKQKEKDETDSLLFL